MKALILNLTLLPALLVAAYGLGVLQMPFDGDRTGLCYGIAGLFLIAIVCRHIGWLRIYDWIAGNLTTLGFIGTVVGLVIALSGVDVEKATQVESIGPMVKAMVSGMGTAFYTTLVGAVCALWLSLCEAADD